MSIHHEHHAAESTPTDPTQRARRYADALMAGRSRDEVGAPDGISGSRVYEIVAEAGLMAEVKAVRGGQLKEDRRERGRRMDTVRGRRWADALIAGETLDSIGQREGLTRERVRQVVVNAGLMPEVKEKKAAQRAAKKAAYRAEIERRAQVRKMSVRDATNLKRKWTDEAVIEAVRQWLATDGPKRASDWDAEGQSPSAILITQRFGWSNAIRLAGGDPGRTITGHRSDRWSEQECIYALVAFLTDPTERSGSYAAYGAWASRYGMPSSQAVRNRFGTWGAAKQIALDRIAA